MHDKQKDIGERTLESYGDVFADIVNAVLFGGRDHPMKRDISQNKKIFIGACGVLRHTNVNI